MHLLKLPLDFWVSLPAVEESKRHAYLENWLKNRIDKHLLARFQIQSLIVPAHPVVPYPAQNVISNRIHYKSWVYQFFRFDHLLYWRKIVPNHVSIVQEYRYQTVENVSVNLVFLLKNEDHDNVDSEHHLLSVPAEGAVDSTEVEDQRALLN